MLEVGFVHFVLVTEDYEMTGHEVLTMISIIAAAAAAIAAGFSAFAAWQANARADSANRIAETAALLGRLPLPVPWVDSPSTSLKVVNRGSSTAHHVGWTIVIDGEKLANGQLDRILNPGSSASLTHDQHAIVARIVTGAEFRIICSFTTSWGEAFKLERTYAEGKSQDLALFKPSGDRISMLGELES